MKKSSRILVTAGPTRENIDPVRFISNYSTGLFGYEIAKEAVRRGYPVTLVSGPTALVAPAGVKFIGVESALDMRRAVLGNFKKCALIIMAAAVSDWRPRSYAAGKIKRSAKKIALELIQNPDILCELGRIKGRKVLVGFALETDDLEKNALRKMAGKNLDIVVANKLGAHSALFGDKHLDILLMDRFGHKERLRNKSKRRLAQIILDKALTFNI